ncbi:MAG: hypothetical protein ACRYFX_15110 [Janthinobacterium lividum]
MSRYLLLPLLTLALPAAGQEIWNKAVPADIVILRSTKSYPAALQTARQAAAKLHLKLDLGGNQPNAQSGLTLSKADCASDGYDYPSYLARGNGLIDDAPLVSVEYSTAYEGFAKGYYIVVAAVGAPGSAAVQRTKTAAQAYYPDAYAKRTRVWRGCMH